MKLIVGLGNPGKEYENTRHNAGYIFLDKLACTSQIAPVGECVRFEYNKKFDSKIAEISHKGEKILMVKPETYMNLSGTAVDELMKFYKLSLDDLITVVDDKDLPLGTARIRNEGGSAGQKGLQNIIDMLKSDNFVRVRIGINAIAGDADLPSENLSKMNTVDFVLSKFDKREVPVLNMVIEDTILYLLRYIGSDQAVTAHTIQVKIDSL